MGTLKKGGGLVLIRQIGDPHTELISAPQVSPHTQSNNNGYHAITLNP